MDPKKEKILNDWSSVRNAIFKASFGEMKVTYIRESEVDEKKKDLAGTDKDGVVGVFVDLMLRFAEPLPPKFSDEEKKAVEEAIEAGKKDAKEAIESEKKEKNK